MRHEDWLLKAKNDLKSAKILANSNVLDTAIYHTQQCAEKALKAYLIFKVIQTIKTHDLVFLSEQCRKINIKFEELFKSAVLLSPYSTEFRYPDDYLGIPSLILVNEAIEESEKILNFVLEFVFKEATGQENIF